MKPKHVLLALLIAAMWGVNFVVIKVGLDSFPPLLLAALRFVLAALPALILPRPQIPWPRLIALGTAWFVGQFGFLFTAMAVGMPPGLASVVLQSQAFFTIVIGALALGEVPGWRQTGGACVALAGLYLIGTTAGTGGVTIVGMAFTLAAAVCWASGNILMRRTGKADMLPLIVWLSLVPPLPLFGLSYVLEGPERIAHAFSHMNMIGAGAVLYIAVFATIAGFGGWGRLLKLYPAGTVAPFSLLVPVFGASSAAFLLGEGFGGAKLAGMALILTGLAVVVLPAPKAVRLSRGKA